VDKKGGRSVGDEISLSEELLRRRPAPPAGEASQAARDWRARAGEEDQADSAAPSEQAEAVEPEVNDLAFGYYRGVRERASHIEFQRLQDSWPAAGYAWLPCPVWQPSGDGKGRGQVIILEYVTGLKVTVRGRNLRPYYERILRQQVFRVTEMGEEADQYFPEDAAVVYAIEVALPDENSNKKHNLQG
jgi:hypothetical protein